jgi:Uma2 family endonuclease
MEDLVARMDSIHPLYELVDGVLVEKTVGFYESTLAGVLIQLLRNFLDQHDLGTISGPDGMLELRPALVRGPDVTFARWDRFPEGRPSPEDSVPAIAPDLAVEVISRGNSTGEMTRKLDEYFPAGCRLVWYLYSKRRVLLVYTSPQHRTIIPDDGVLDGGDVLPGFSLRVADWLAGARPRKSAAE